MEKMKFSISTPELSFQFINLNSQMKLRGHYHFATVQFTFASEYHDKVVGFPVFEDTVKEIHDKVLELTKKPLRDTTNEGLTFLLFDEISKLKITSAEKWNCDKYWLKKVKVNIRGVRDDIGHSDGFAEYVLEIDE